MHEDETLDQPELLEQHRADQPVEVTPGNQPISLHRHRNLLTGRQTPLSSFLVGVELRVLDREVSDGVVPGVRRTFRPRPRPDPP
jgi:hypothetical protein